MERQRNIEFTVAGMWLSEILQCEQRNSDKGHEKDVKVIIRILDLKT